MKFKLPANPEISLQVSNPQGEIGRLFIKDGIIGFSGDASESAAVFLNEITRRFPEILSESHRRGWEQAKREAYCLSRQHSLLSSTKSGEIEINELAIAIATLEYKEPTNDCTRI